MAAATRHPIRMAFAAGALGLALGLAPGPLRAAAPADTLAAPAPLFDSARGFRLVASQMLGQENVGGRRHILIDVYLTQGTARVTAPRGYYYQDRDLTALAGDVQLADSTLHVRADSAAWHRDTQLLEVFGNVIVNDHGLRLAGENGFYDRRDETIRLTGSVSGEQASRRFHGDRLDYRRDTGRVVIQGRGRFDDPDRHAVVYGDRLDYDRATGQAWAEGNPSLDWQRGENRLAVAGRRLRFLEGGDRFEAAGDVMVRQERQTVTADSAVFFDRAGVGLFFGHPRVTDGEGIVTGDSLAVHFAGNEIERAVMRGQAMLDYRPADPDLAGERSQVAGDSLIVRFDDGKIGSLQALGRPSVDYAPSYADSARGTGWVKAGADTVLVAITGGAVDRVELQGTARGTYRYRSHVTTDSLEQVDYSSRRIVFRIRDRYITLRGQSQTDYRQLTLKADDIDFDAAREALTAEPRPVLIDHSRGAGQDVVGQRVRYDLRSSRGTIYHGRTEYESGFIFADSLRKVTDEELNAGSGRYTTCDLVGDDREPHYHFTSRRMKILLGDKVVARPVTLYLGRIPVFVLPFYVFSIRKGRHSGLLLPRFEFGLSNQGGRFFENLGYYWAANDYSDFTVRTAYREKPGVFIGEGTARYVQRGVLNGTLDVGHAFGLDRGLNQFALRHNQTLGENFRLTANLEFADPEYRNLRGLSQGIGNRVDRQLRSNAGLTKSWRTAGISLGLSTTIEKALDVDPADGLDETRLSRVLPQLSFSVNSRTLGRVATADRPALLPWASTLSWGVNFNGRVSHSEAERTRYRAASDTTVADTTYAIIDTDSRTGHWTFNLRDNRRLFGFFNITPQLNATEYWVDREFSPGDTTMGFRRAATWSLGLSGGLNAYGTLAPHLFGVEAIRHTFSPSVTLSYNPDFTSLSYVDTAGVRRARFPGVGASRSQALSYSIENRFQAKVRRGGETKRVDLFSWRLGGSYDILAARDGRPRPATDIQSSLNLNRVQGVSLNFSSVHDPYRRLRARSFSAQAGFQLSGKLPGAPGENAATAPAGAAPAPDDGSTPPPDQPAEAQPAVGYDDAPSVYDRPKSGGAQSDALTWRTGFTFSWSGNRGSDDQINGVANVSANADLRLSKNWGMRYTDAYSFETKEFTYHQVDLSRTLHCWEAAFSYRASPLQNEFYFRISVRDLPDLKFESGPGLGAFDSLSRLAPGGTGF